MQSEKKFLVDEVVSYLDRSDYIFLVDFTGLSVAETEELRQRLAEVDAEFHVVKNRIFKRATSEREYPEMDEWLKGHTGLIFGGEQIPLVAKAVEKFQKDKKKLEVKGAVISKELISSDDFAALKDLPTLDGVRAQLLALLNTPATQIARLLNTPAQQFLNIVDARKRDLEEKGGAEA
ncbi:MAG: large subunit ribosomal protein L10 [Puniceicoccaceae bacterium 5H]|nr:MAG: large subunit ribosomal protein L10 [Puniceicoccaceae bacterium 5H]